LGPEKDCPAIEDLEQVMTGAIDSSTAVARHVHSCSYCQTELRMLQAFSAGGDGQTSDEVNQVISRLRANPGKVFPKREAAEASVPWWKAAFSVRGIAQASLAAAVVLLVAAAVLRVHTVKSPSMQALNQTSQEIFRSGSFDLVEPVGDLQEPPKEIRWEKVENAANYRVRLLEVDKSEIWKAETAENHIDLPPPVRVRIVPAKTLFCEVEAVNSSGIKVSGTGLIRFRLVQNAGTHQ
jgi:hypothetical protein